MGFFSVNVLNRKKIFIDSDASAAAFAVEDLKKAGIPCELHTKRMRSTIGVRMDVGSYMRLNQAYVGNPQQYIYTYTVYVPRKHFEKARKVLHI